MSQRKSKRSSTSTDHHGSKRKKKSSFVVDMRLRNELPDIPMNPKWIKVPWKPERLYNYHKSTLEQKYSYRVHMEPTIGLPINMIDPSTAENPSATLQQADVFLLRRENDEVQDYLRGAGDGKALSSFGTSLSVRRIYDANSVRQGKHWLRRTMYMDNNQFAQQNNQISGTEELMKQSDALAKRIKQAEINLKDKSERIERSFALSKEAPIHAEKPNMKPVKVFDILPDFNLVEQPLYQTHLIDERLLDGVAVPSGDETSKKYSKTELALLSRTLLYPCSENSSAVSFLIPTEEASNPKDFRWVRDYQYTIGEGQKMDKFMFIWNSDDINAGSDAANPLHSTVVFGGLEPTVLTLNRTATGSYNTEKSRQQAINVTRRAFDEEEMHDREVERKHVEEGYYLDDMNLGEKTIQEDLEVSRQEDPNDELNAEISSEEERELDGGTKKNPKKVSSSSSSSSSSDSSSDSDSN